MFESDIHVIGLRSEDRLTCLRQQLIIIFPTLDINETDKICEHILVFIGGVVLYFRDVQRMAYTVAD